MDAGSFDDIPACRGQLANPYQPGTPQERSVPSQASPAGLAASPNSGTSARARLKVRHAQSPVPPTFGDGHFPRRVESESASRSVHGVRRNVEGPHRAVGNAPRFGGLQRGPVPLDRDGDHDLYITNRIVYQNSADATSHLFRNDGADPGEQDSWLFADVSVPPMTTQGYGQVPISIPNDRSLIGGHFYTQFWNVDLAANALHLTFTDAIDTFVGGYFP